MFNNDLISLKLEEKNQLKEEITQNEISKFINLISERILQMEIVYVIDRIEGKYAVCENRSTGEMCNIELSQIPINAKEGTVLRYKDDKYILDEETQNEIENRITKKMNKLWNN